MFQVWWVFFLFHFRVSTILEVAFRGLMMYTINKPNPKKCLLVLAFFTGWRGGVDSTALFFKYTTLKKKVVNFFYPFFTICYGYKSPYGDAHLAMGIEFI